MGKHCIKSEKESENNEKEWESNENLTLKSVKGMKSVRQQCEQW